MLEMGISEKLVNLIKETLNRINFRVKLGTELSHVFYIEEGQKLGESSFCQLFNIALEEAIRDLGIRTRKNIFTKSVRLLAFKDNIDIVERTKVAIVEAFCACESATKNIGLIVKEDQTLTVNEEKTKFMTITNRGQIYNL
ncbi:reverse transcriptase domain-containing protein [Caerostris darwini]|uniref:Reverse transcriptase domain-containing protein n=1 Tax=Caerostris darwini TaxID=1538125 RepID=A0AAV4PZC5_9ARAC|nr:reverse transcriptase domain-containing protein [Caerostris darwini]